MVIDKPQPVLTAINQDIRTDLIDHPGDPRAVGEDAVDCFLSKDIRLRTGITELVPDINCTEQELKLWVCNKHDPESKGPILYASFFYPQIHQLPDAYHALLAKRFG